MKVTVNMNEYVKVRLTEYGISIIKIRHGKLQQFMKSKREFTPPETDSEGYSKFQLWELFELFGGWFGLAKPNCFDLEIVFEK